MTSYTVLLAATSGTLLALWVFTTAVAALGLYKWLQYAMTLQELWTELQTYAETNRDLRLLVWMATKTTDGKVLLTMPDGSVQAMDPATYSAEMFDPGSNGLDEEGN